MFRSQALRISRSSTVAVPVARSVTRLPFDHRICSLSPMLQVPRLYSTNPPPPPPAGQPAPNPKAKGSSSNGFLWVALGIAAAAGGYYYYANPQDVNDLKKKAKEDQEEMARKARESVQAGKSRADDAYKQGLNKYDEAKVSPFNVIH